MGEVLAVRDLEVRFHTERGTVHAVNGASFHVEEGETLAIVGESGSGKSVSLLACLQLVAQPPGEVTNGEVVFEERDLLRVSAHEIRKVRGNKIAMIFQDPMTFLNPVMTIGRQITEALELHMGLNRSTARARAIELLELVGIPDPSERITHYPHQFSGGMRQRCMIAMALSCNPRVLIADEPTTALDVTIQAQILDLMRSTVTESGAALILITHDLGIVSGRQGVTRGARICGFFREPGCKDAQPSATRRAPIAQPVLSCLAGLSLLPIAGMCSGLTCVCPQTRITLAPERVKGVSPRIEESL